MIKMIDECTKWIEVVNACQCFPGGMSLYNPKTKQNHSL